MDALSENSPREVKPSKNVNLFNLDKNIAHLISGYLTDKYLVNLCKASKGLYGLFHPSLEKRLMSYFLKDVAEGRLDKVEEILNKNKKLVFLHGDIIDLSGRVFKRITAFQYVTWALDKEMWELILKYLPEVDAYNQLIELEQKRPDITQAHGVRLNFEPLLNAYQKYINNFGKWSLEQGKACWCKEVGGAQRQMPAWYIYVFCEEGRDKAWPTDSFKKSFTRDPKHLRWWFEEEHNGGKLGFKWGAYRASDSAREAGGSWGGLEYAGTLDRARTSQFMTDRTDELSQLVERLFKACSGEKKLAPKSNNF